jgi:hypothetical protein
MDGSEAPWRTIWGAHRRPRGGERLVRAAPRAGRNLGDRFRAERTDGCRKGQKHVRVRDVGADAFPIDEERVAHLLRQWQACSALRLAGHAERGVMPVNIAPLERRDLTSAESQTGQEHQDGIVAHPTRGRAITGR